MRTHVVAVQAALENVIITAEVALIDLEGVEARIDEDVPSASPQRSKARSKIRRAAVVAGCVYVLLSAFSAQVKGPLQAVPSWTLDSKVHLISRTETAISAFDRG